MVKTARTIMITIKVPRFVAIKDEEIVEAKTTTIPILVPTSNGRRDSHNGRKNSEVPIAIRRSN